jgi:hypothetical protein
MTSSIERPAASWPNTALTVTRVPRMHGNPCIRSGSMQIRSKPMRRGCATGLSSEQVIHKPDDRLPAALPRKRRQEPFSNIPATAGMTTCAEGAECRSKRVRLRQADSLPGPLRSMPASVACEDAASPTSRRLDLKPPMRPRTNTRCRRHRERRSTFHRLRGGGCVPCGGALVCREPPARGRGVGKSARSRRAVDLPARR